MTDSDAWRAGYELLRRRVAEAPALVRAAAALELLPLPFSPSAVRQVITTGVGSSVAHAKLLAHLLAVELGLPAHFAPAAAVGARGGHPRDALIVFSQGLSPNAGVALADAAAWHGVALVTAVEPEGAADAKRALLDALAAAGGVRIALPGGIEDGTLLRIAGPLAGYVIAYRLAAAIGGAAGLPVASLEIDAGEICDAMATAVGAVRAAGDPFAGDVSFVASGGYGELTDNLPLKVLEGLLHPLPPVWDLIGFAHGPYQAVYERAATFVVLERLSAPEEPDLLERFTALLAPERHRIVRLPARLPGPLALFEHEAALNALVLEAIAARAIDQTNWPARGRDAPLYEVARIAVGEPARLAPHRAARTAAGRALATATWPEIDARLAAGCRTAVVPLGSTEQHGPHLPFATDTVIAEALAVRLCARIDAVHVPALALGCSAEHAAFPGTLSVRWDTLRALLVDVVGSLAAHGFETIFLFTAHGGNVAPLRACGAALAAAGRPAQVIVCADLEALTAVFHGASGAGGVAAAAAGHHAGEFETSILLALQPQLVRRDDLHPGLVDVGADPQGVFYPSLRARAPSGVVGDPSAAAAARADQYLDAWVAALVDCYRRAKKSAKTTGTQNA